jgi:hypothetical protein
MPTYAKYDSDGWLIAVSSVQGDDMVIEPAITDGAWPKSVTPSLRPRKVNGALVWQDCPAEEKAADARATRDQLLRECDWTQGRDIADAIATPWAVYRAALRDLTTQEGFPNTVIWPTPPTA